MLAHEGKVSSLIGPVLTDSIKEGWVNSQAMKAKLVVGRPYLRAHPFRSPTNHAT